MTFAVLVEQSGDTYTARLAGEPTISVRATTRAEAVESLRAEVSRRLALGELTFIDIPPVGIHAFAGILKDDPTAADLVEEIYRLRDAVADQSAGQVR